MARKKYLSTDEIYDIIMKNFQFITGMMFLFCTEIPKERTPFLHIVPDYNGAYTCNREIVIGLQMDFFKHCETEEDVIKYVLNLLFHEMMHVKSTPDKAWRWGLNQGVMSLAEALSGILEGKGVRRFSTEKDVDHFCDAMQKKGLALTKQFLQEFCHYIQNALEDGRIERIGSNQSGNMRKLVKGVRGEIWVNNPIEAAHSDPAGQLMDVQNDTLSISTIGAHMKDFDKVYPSGTDVSDWINKIHKYIGMGVWSPTCRQCMRHAIDLEVTLAPLVADALAEETMMQKVMQALSQMLDAHEGADGQGRGVTSKDEEADSDEDANSTYNSLCQQAGDEDAKPSEGNGQKEEEEEKDGQSGSSSSDSESDKDSDGTESSGKSGEEKESGKDSFSGEDKKDGDAAKSQGGDEAGNGGDSEKGLGEDKEQKKIDPKSLIMDREGSDDIVGHASSGKGVDADAVEKQIREAMKAAAAVSKTLSDAATAARKPKPSKPLNCPDKAKPWTTSDDFHERHRDTNFRELKRAYKVRDVLPADVQAEADMFRKKIERLYQKRDVERMTGRKSGRLDVNSFWELKAGRCDVFMKKKEEEERDYCVYILLDNSGSMGNGWGSKRYTACRALAVIEEGFKKFVPMKVVAFDYNGVIVHEVIKGWDEKYDANCSYNFMLHGRGGCGNMDGYDIEIATEELMARKEKKKLLIVMSDGSPAEDTPGDVEHAVQAARDAGIEVASILFGNDLSKYEVDYFHQMYKTNCVCVEPEKISEELARILKGFCF